MAHNQTPVVIERDRHIRRYGEDYTDAFVDLLPRGKIWSRSPGSTIYGVCRGLAWFWEYVDGRAADLLERESDPRLTTELLPEWERAWGLPDPCFPSTTDIESRRKMLVMVMTWLGGQSREYYKKVMEWVGYEDIEIADFGEYAPFMAGISQVGDTRPTQDPTKNQNFRWYIGPPEQRFYWYIRPGTVGLRWFRAGSGQAGVDHHLEFAVPEELECLLNRWKPAHTDLIMDFSQMAFGGPMQGMP